MEFVLKLASKSLLSFILALFFLLTAISSCHAANYYVATGGNDNNPGTLTQPWRNIQKAANNVVAGDTVLIKEGIYSESIQPKYSGTQNAYITYKAYSTDPNKRPVIDGASSGGNLIRIGKSYLEFNGLEIRNSGARGIAISGGATKVRIINSLVHDSQLSGIVILQGTSNITIQNVKSYRNGIYGIPGGHGLILYEGGNDSQILDSEFYNNGRDPGVTWASGIELCGNVQFVLVKNNRVYGNTMHGIDVCGFSNQNTVSQNISYRNSRIGIAIDGDANNNLVDRNIIYENGPASGWGGGIHLWRGAVKNKIYNNVVYQNYGSQGDGGGIRFISGAGNSSINNIVKNNVTFLNNYYDIRIALDNNVAEEDYNNFAGNKISYLGQTYNLAGYKNISGHSQHSIATNPVFVDQANYNFRLQNTSPNIDAGVDIGLPFVGSAPDIGAFEYVSGQPSVTPSPSPSPSLPICFNSADSIINADDAKFWANIYLSNTINLDTNSDNKINIFEFGYLVSHWGQSCQ